jgi:hypothetical protein
MWPQSILLIGCWRFLSRERDWNCRGHEKRDCDQKEVVAEHTSRVRNFQPNNFDFSPVLLSACAHLLLVPEIYKAFCLRDFVPAVY